MSQINLRKYLHTIPVELPSDKWHMVYFVDPFVNEKRGKEYERKDENAGAAE